ncbi:MAG: EAL domain-containing protein [Burkholderiales bacterium]|nr:EAL domain-containing protein [Burkholderiales bacterium]
MHYQPVVDTDRVVTGVEALLRWLHPRAGRCRRPNLFR